MSKIANITYLDYWSGREFVTRADLNAKFLCEMSEVTFFRLWSALLFFRANIARDFTNEGKSTSLIEFMGSFKKGSRYCRNIFSKNQVAKINTCSQESVTTFFNLIGEQVLDTATVENVLPLWCLSALPNSFCEFLFKFFNNRLGLNQRTAHFGGVTRSCTFCFVQKCRKIEINECFPFHC